MCLNRKPTFCRQKEFDNIIAYLRNALFNVYMFVLIKFYKCLINLTIIQLCRHNNNFKDHMKQQEKTLGDLAIKKREKIKELKEQCCYWEENVIEIKKECLTLEKNLNSKGSHSENGILEKIEEVILQLYNFLDVTRTYTC